MAAEVQLGGAEYVTVPLGADESISCVQSGLWLVRDGHEPVVVMLKSADGFGGEQLTLEVMATDRDRAQRVVVEVRRLMSVRNVYRARVLELRARHFHEDEGAPLTVRSLPDIAREQIVLADGVLEAIERQALAWPATPSAFAQAGDTCDAGCSCTAHRASARRSRRCTSRRGCPTVPSCSSPARASGRSAPRSTSPRRCNRRW
jgi:hypothetical protein